MAASQTARADGGAFRREPAKSHILTDADLLRLFRRDHVAKSVLMLAKVIANGKLEKRIRIDTLADELGLHRRTVQKALRRIEAAGVVVVHQKTGAGGDIAHLFVLDRRRVAALQPVHLEVVKSRGGVAEEPHALGCTKPFSNQPPTSAGLEKGPSALSRAGPGPPSTVGDDDEPRDITAAGLPLPPDAPDERRGEPPPAHLLEPELTELRHRLAGDGQIGREQRPVDRDVLRSAGRWLVHRGASALKVELAAQALAFELGITRPSVEPSSISPDKEGNGA